MLRCIRQPGWIYLNVCRYGFAFLILTMFIFSGMTSGAHALSEKNFRAECKTELNKWKKRDGYGAAAVSRNGRHCGFSWQAQSLEEARTRAISSCSSGKKGRGCEVTSELKNASEYVLKNKNCEKETGQSKVDACTWLIKLGRDKGKQLAWNYQSRAKGYYDLKLYELEIDDYSSAIEILKKESLLYYLRGATFFLLADYDLALNDFNLFFKYDKGEDKEVKEAASLLLRDTKAALDNIKRQSNQEICKLAVDSKTLDWDQARTASSYVNEAKARGLNIGTCRQTEVVKGLSDPKLCNLAVSATGTSWEQSTGYAPHVQAAKARGFSVESCRVLIFASQLRPNPGNTPAKAGALASQNDQTSLLQVPAKYLCQTALTVTKKDWDPNYLPHVSEAKRRGLSINDCRVVLNLRWRTGDPELNAQKAVAGNNAPTGKSAIEHVRQFNNPRLCHLALSFGQKEWDRALTLHVGEAKRRALSVNDCRLAIGLPGIPELEATGASDTKLCNSALANRGTQWETRPEWARFSREAQRRGLSIADCRAVLNLPRLTDDPALIAQQDVAGSYSPASKSGNEQVRQLNNQSLCSFALSFERKHWVSLGPHVGEAQRRALSVNDCRLAIGLPSIPELEATGASDTKLCNSALTASRTQWETSTEWARFSLEAQRRGLTVDDCRAALNLPRLAIDTASNSTETKDASDRRICTGALHWGRTKWETSTNLVRFSVEAQRRGLTIETCRAAIGLPATEAQKSEVEIADASEAETRKKQIAKLKEIMASVDKISNANKAPEIAAPRQFGKRVALVIGNSTYQHARLLLNPANDAELMTATLEKVGFTVTKVLDADQKTMKIAMDKFGNDVQEGAEASLFYYAGHAMQVDLKNYLIPVDAEITREQQLDAHAIDVNAYLKVMDSPQVGVKIIVLDSCRNNGFQSDTRSLSRGLAPVTAPTGTYIAYSTALGAEAEDGDGKNSLYTAALARSILLPGLQIEATFKNTRRILFSENNQRQVPWETGSLIGDFYFLPAN